jgi:hypothetical protein
VDVHTTPQGQWIGSRREYPTTGALDIFQTSGHSPLLIDSRAARLKWGHLPETPWDSSWKHYWIRANIGNRFTYCSIIMLSARYLPPILLITPSTFNFCCYSHACFQVFISNVRPRYTLHAPHYKRTPAHSNRYCQISTLTARVFRYRILSVSPTATQYYKKIIKRMQAAQNTDKKSWYPRSTVTLLTWDTQMEQKSRNSKSPNLNISKQKLWPYIHFPFFQSFASGVIIYT